MSGPTNWLPIVAVVGVAAAGFLGLHRWVAKQTTRIRSVLDGCDYVVIEAVPEQLQGMRNDFEASGWRLGESKPNGDRAMLYRFDKIDDLSSPLSELLRPGKKASAPFADEPVSDFQIKIKAHGLRRDLNAQAG